MANWEDIRSEWETTKITLSALAEKHSIKLGTLKVGRAVKDGQRIQRKRMQPKAERNHLTHPLKILLVQSYIG